MVIGYNADPATPPIRTSCQAIKQASSGDHGDSLHYWLWGDFGGVDCSGGWWSQRLSPLLTLRRLWLDVVEFIVVVVVDGRDNDTVQHWLCGDYEIEAVVSFVVIMVVSIDTVQQWFWGDLDMGDLGVDRVVVVIGDSADRQMRISDMYLIGFNHLILDILFFNLSILSILNYRRPCYQRRPQPRRSWTNSLRVPPRRWSWLRQLRPRPSGIVIFSGIIRKDRNIFFCILW